MPSTLPDKISGITRMYLHNGQERDKQK